MTIALGKIYYRTSIDEEPKIGQIEGRVNNDRIIRYGENTYTKPTEWIKTEFASSGRSIRYPDIPKLQDTPRKQAFYQPPRKRSFGDFT